MWIEASNSKVPLFFTIVAFLVRWCLDRTFVGLWLDRVSMRVRHWSQSCSLS
jgi:hypothetical protein